jgi:hypothetical protein
MTHSIERGSSETESQPINEIRIGRGDVIRVNKVEEIGYEKKTNPLAEQKVYQNELPPEELEAIRDQLAELPFHIGLTEKEGSFGNMERPVYDTNIKFLQAGEQHDYKGVAREDLVILFNTPDALSNGVYPETANGLKFVPEYPVKKGEKPRLIMQFTPEKALKMGKRNIKDVRLVMPMPEGN